MRRGSVTHQISRAATVATAIVGLACTTIPLERYDPFVQPEAQVRSAVEAVVATPLQYPDDLRVASSVARRIDSVIESELEAAGIRVVSAIEYSEIWDRILRQMGGFFDPVSGDRDQRQFEAARRELLRELRGRFGTAVMLYAELEIVDAVVDDGVAEWDGMSQPVTGRDLRILEPYRATFEEDAYGSQRHGTIGAVTLVLGVDGPDGEELYRHFGGLEVLTNLAPSDRDPEFQLVADPGRVVFAVGIVVGPLKREATASR